MMKKMKKKIKAKPIFKTLDAGMYPIDILFTIGTTEAQVIKYIRNRCKYDLDDEELIPINFRGKGGKTIRFKNNAILVWVKNPGLPVIGHEIFHVVEYVMDTIGSPINSDTGEPCAYLTENIWRQIVPLIK